jgi:multiple sugar transport system permease protein
MSKGKIKKIFYRFIRLYLPLAFFLLWALFPLFWMIVTSIKPNQEFMTLKDTLVVKNPTLDQYNGLLSQTEFPIWFLNSFVISVGATVLSLVVSCLAAYAISRLQFKGRWVISRGVLFAYLVPRTILFLPLFGIVQALQLTDTLQGLVLVYLTFMVPFCTWLLVGYFSSVPQEVEECALLDGCSRLRVLFSIVIPMAAPGIVTASLFSFTLSWNEYLYPLVINTMSKFQVVPVGVSSLMTGDIFQWGKIMATGVLFTVPVIFLYLPIQKYIAEGLSAGAVKG